MTDDQLEQEIQAKGLTAPRITPDHIEATIAHQYFFTAAEALAARYEGGFIDPALNVLTFCVLVLKNGFTVTGESACARPENFDVEIGRTIARQNAMQKIWALEGYLLKNQIATYVKELTA